MFAPRSLRAGVSVFARCVRVGGVLVAGLEFLNDPAKVAEACSDLTDAFFQSVEGDTPDAGTEG